MGNANPYSDGKIRGTADAIIRAIVVSIVIVVSWQAPFAWYWRIATFVALMFVVGIIYPTVQMALAVRKQRRLLDATDPVDPFYEKMLECSPDAKAMHEETRAFRARMRAMTKAMAETNKPSDDQ